MAEPAPALNLRDEIDRLWHRKWWIIGSTTLAFVLAFVFTLPHFMPYEYRSTAAFIPPGIEYVNSINFRPGAYKGLGAPEDEDLELMAGLLTSDSVRNYIVKKFDLLERYGLADMTDRNQQQRKLQDQYDYNVEVGLTRWSTVEVNVYDTDPHVARDIAREFLVLANNAVEDIAKRRVGIVAAQRQVDSIAVRIAEIQDTLSAIRRNYRVFDLAELGDVSAAQIQSAILTPEFGRYYDFVVQHEELLDYLSEIHTQLVQEIYFRKQHLENFPMLINVVSEPVVNYAKERPKRMLLVLLAAFGAFALVSLSVLVFDRKRAQ